jgi:hypothetical protein
VDPVAVTAWGTVALAVVGFISIVTGILLAIGTFRGVRANRETTAVQQRQLDLLARQITLQEEQAETAREAARPKLRCSLAGVGQLYVEGSIAYVHGTDPAEQIEVWLRGQPRPGAGWGLYRAWIGFMSASDRELPLRAVPASAVDQDRLPYADFLDGDVGHAEMWVLLTWRRPDGTLDHRADRQHLDGTPPGELELKRPR